MINRILVAVDGSIPAARAVDVAVELATELGAQLAAVHVLDASRAFMPEFGLIDAEKMADLRRAGTLALDAARAQVPASMELESLCVEGEPGEEIIETAHKWSADLIVIGSDARGRLAHFLLGSTADAVIRKAPCPVVSVRPDVPAPTREAAVAVA